MIKISPLLKKQVDKYKVSVCYSLLGITVLYITGKELNKARKETFVKNQYVKEYLKHNAPDIYNNYELNKMPISTYYEIAKRVEDSLKLDSIAKTNYTLSMQAVRDSLSNINK